MKKLFIPPVCVFICFLLMSVFYFLLHRYNLVLFPVNLGGVPIAFFGFVSMGKARELFRKHRTTLAIERPSSLITEGIFSKTRNPMYGGMFLLLLGVGILLHEAIGSEYLEYKKKVGRWV